MHEFTITDMSCGHCVGVITKTVQRLDPNATVETDLASKKVRVDSSQPRDAIVHVLDEAGYTPA
ncbi:MAG: heavy-metal-associated domain-containing protein [Rhodoferax sp.]|nr:heavy-metal-associated domain-containing protein [Rhodoferax sp.]